MQYAYSRVSAGGGEGVQFTIPDLFAIRMQDHLFSGRHNDKGRICKKEKRNKRKKKMSKKQRENVHKKVNF